MKQVYHAVVFDGDRTPALSSALTYVRDVLNVATDANPDLRISHYETFGIGDAHEHREHASQRPFGERQVFVIVAERMTVPAQNALLKILEEPSPDTHFILVLPTRSILLPTVQSRLLAAARTEGELGAHDIAQTFLSANPGERSKLIADIVKNKERTKARELVNALEFLLHREGVQKHTTALREVAFIRQYLADNASSLKMLLEHLVVTVPMIQT